MISDPDSLLSRPASGLSVARIMNMDSDSAPILIATNDAELIDTLSEILGDKHLRTTTASETGAIIREVGKLHPHALLLDSRFLEDTTALICRRLRSNHGTGTLPIIVITSPDNVVARIQALESGADDCVTAPGDLRELAARIRARVRKDMPRPRGLLHAGPIELDLDRWTAHVSGKPIALTKKEFMLLQALIESHGRTLSRKYLLQTVWSLRAAVETRTIDVHIARLRRKLGSAGRYILTVRNVGFRFDLVPDWVTGQVPPGTD